MMTEHQKVEKKNPEELLSSLGRTKKRILIELYRDSVGYKRLSKIIGVGLDTVRSHIRTGKYSRSLYQMGLVEKGGKSEEKGWQLNQIGLEVVEFLQKDPEFKAFFYDE